MKLKELFEQKEISVLTVDLGQQPENYEGDFYCYDNDLTSLEDCPQKVGGNFSCSSNQLTSLEGGPQEVGGDFNCYHNQLTSLEGGPQEVGGNFWCYHNQLTSLEGGPQKVGKDFDCSNNELTNLKDIHKHIKFIGHSASFLENPIESHVVGLLLIKGLTRIYLDNEQVRHILNKHLSNGRDVFACIDELEGAGFPEFAKI